MIRKTRAVAAPTTGAYATQLTPLRNIGEQYMLGKRRGAGPPPLWLKWRKQSSKRSTPKTKPLAAGTTTASEAPTSALPRMWKRPAPGHTYTKPEISRPLRSATHNPRPPQPPPSPLHRAAAPPAAPPRLSRSPSQILRGTMKSWISAARLHVTFAIFTQVQWTVASSKDISSSRYRITRIKG